MGDRNQFIYLSRHVPSVDGPVLEVGSKDYGNTQNFRALYREVEYVGVDMEAGKGVEVVHDLTTGTGPLPLGYFKLIICCSVLEHVRRPWVFADHLQGLLRPGGQLYMAVPWVWRYHAYPDDYFRFSWRGVEELFPELDWADHFLSTNIENEFFPAGPGSDDRLHMLKHISGGVSRKYLPYIQVHMIGTKGVVDAHQEPA